MLYLCLVWQISLLCIINLIASAAGDVEYQRIISALQSGANAADLEEDHPAQHFREKWHELSIMQLENEEHPLIIRNGKQIVIPRTARKNLLRELHRGHSGISKSCLTAKELYYWPSMKSDISNHVAACSACTEDLPAQPSQKLDEEKKPTDAGAPMEELGVDYFDALGRNWLVAVDRYSGYAWTAKITKATTENTLTQLVAWLDKFGLPKRIRSDGGPQFRQAFTSFCKLHGISHELSLAYNPESNGLAEAAVKSMKALVVRTKKLGENLLQAIACWRNMKRQNGTSLAELFWGRTQRHRLPMHNGKQTQEQKPTGAASRDDLHSKQVKARNLHTLYSQETQSCWRTAPAANGQRRSPYWV